MSRILVTGGAGFIGGHLVDALATAGHEVVVVDNFCSGKRTNLARSAAKVRLVEGDICFPASWAKEVRQVDCIVHLAALISGYDSLVDADAYEDVNVRGLLRVIEFARDQRVSRIVFASSSTVYGDREGAAMSEGANPEPLTVYALTKLAGEHLLRMYGQLYGFTHVSLRLFNVYGPRQAVDHPYANVTCKFSHAAANNLPIRRYGDGTQSRDFVFVSDVIAALLAVLEGSKRSIYNVGTGQFASINTLISTLEEIRGAPLTIEQYDRWPNDIQAIAADTSLFEKEFAFRADVSLADGLQRTVEFFLPAK